MLNISVLGFLQRKLNYPRSQRLACIALLFFSICSQVQALENFLPSKTILHDENKVEDYRLILSSLKKVNGQWQTAREMRMTGTLQRTTVELAGGHTVEEGFNFYLQQLNEVSGSREIFSCTGLKCGPSSSWANIRFQQKELYGLDKYQYYSVWALPDDSFVSLYGIRRGNKRVYLRQEILSSEKVDSAAIATAPETIIHALNHEGAYTLFPPTYAKEEGNSHLKSLIKALQTKRLMKITLQSFEHGPGVDSNSADMLVKLEWLKGVLVAGGIRESRITLDATTNPALVSASGVRLLKTPRP